MCQNFINFYLSDVEKKIPENLDKKSQTLQKLNILNNFHFFKCKNFLTIKKLPWKSKQQQPSQSQGNENPLPKKSHLYFHNKQFSPKNLHIRVTPHIPRAPLRNRIEQQIRIALEQIQFTSLTLVVLAAISGVRVANEIPGAAQIDVALRSRNHHRGCDRRGLGRRGLDSRFALDFRGPETLPLKRAEAPRLALVHGTTFQSAIVLFAEVVLCAIGLVGFLEVSEEPISPELMVDGSEEVGQGFRLTRAWALDDRGGEDDEDQKTQGSVRVWKMALVLVFQVEIMKLWDGLDNGHIVSDGFIVIHLSWYILWCISRWTQVLR